MHKKEFIAIGIALQTQVLKRCPVHGELHFDDEENMGRAFALAVELVRHHTELVGEFGNDSHELTDLLSEVLGRAPACCPRCYAHPRQTMEAGAWTPEPSVLSIEALASH